MVLSVLQSFQCSDGRKESSKVLGHGLRGVEKTGGVPSHPAYFKENVVTRTPAVHRKAQANKAKKNSRISGQLTLNGIWYNNWTTIGQFASYNYHPSGRVPTIV